MSTKFYGLTGGIGAGKSTVAKIFQNLGVATLDLDVVGKDVLHQQNIREQLTQAFGKDILINNTIDTTKLRNIAFSSEKKTEQLNHIMHPAIRDRELEWREAQTTPFAIIEASVLIESGDMERMDGLIVVLADIEQRKERVLARGHQDERSFERIIQRQCDDEQRIQAADYILHNNDDIKTLQKEVKQLYTQLRNMSI